MAKQKSQIVGSVRIGGTVYTAGMEEELGKVITKDQAERLAAKGVITGVEASKEAAAKADEGEGSKTGSRSAGDKAKDNK